MNLFTMTLPAPEQAIEEVLAEDEDLGMMNLTLLAKDPSLLHRGEVCYFM